MKKVCIILLFTMYALLTFSQSSEKRSGVVQLNISKRPTSQISDQPVIPVANSGNKYAIDVTSPLSDYFTTASDKLTLKA